MNKILIFDDRGNLYFKKRSDLVTLRTSVIEGTKGISKIQLEHDSELVLYSVDDKGDGYMWSSESERQDKMNWLSSINELFGDGVFIICDYDWSAGQKLYEKALDKIMNTIKTSQNHLAFMLYSTVKFIDADRQYTNDKRQFPDNIIAATEAITFNETLEDMCYALGNEIPYIFES